MYFAAAEQELTEFVASSQKLNSTGTTETQQGGYFCEVCECMLKDSVSYIDHINGKKRECYFFCASFVYLI
jgi:U4/U6.U5 tri-snRNP component SNU23